MSLLFLKDHRENRPNTFYSINYETTDNLLSVKTKIREVTGIPPTKLHMRTGTLTITPKENSQTMQAAGFSDDAYYKVSVNDTDQFSAHLFSSSPSRLAQVGYWSTKKHPYSTTATITGAGTGIGYLTLHEKIGLWSLAAGGAAGLVIALIVGALIKKSIPADAWNYMESEERVGVNILSDFMKSPT